jgi:hypothetical protein
VPDATYADLLRDPRWQKKRLEVMARDNFTCRLCADRGSTLAVHHLVYERAAAPWEYHQTLLLTVCKTCHDELHELKFGESILQALVMGGARMRHLYDVLQAFQAAFVDGPGAGPLVPKMWNMVPGAIADAIRTVRRAG